MKFKNYYEILEIDKNADADAVEKAYRKLARKYHADINPGDKEAEAHYAEISEAHKVLANPDKRAKYDQLRANWNAHLRTGDEASFDWSEWLIILNSLDDYSINANNVSGTAQVEESNGTSEFYASIFKGVGAEYDPDTPLRGEDYHQTVEISLEEAFKGCSRILRIGDRRIKVKIPRGAQTGTKVRVRNEGGPGQGGAPNGDLYLEINVTPDPIFNRIGDDLYADLPVDLYTAVLGGEATVPTFKGKIKLKISPETQSGRTFRLKGQGMPYLNQPDERGELYIRVIIHIPENLTDEEFALFEELADLRGL